MKVLIIDGNSLINRAFYGLPLLTNSKGQYTGAIFGFTNILIKIMQDEMPTHVIVAFDHARKTFRNQIFAEYKGTRNPTPQELVIQIPMLKDLLGKMNIKCIEQEGIEADDIVGTLCQMIPFEKEILSGDKDLFQLLKDNTKCIFMKKGISETEILTKDNLREKFGYSPDMVIELKALMGDHSDNIPGVAGIGPKTAISLLEKYGSLDNIYASLDSEKGALKEKLSTNKDMAYMSKTLATIKQDCVLENFNIDDCKRPLTFSNEVYGLFEDYEFKSLLKRKDLFSEEQKIEEKVKVEELEFKTIDDVKAFCENARKNKVFAFNMISNFEMSYSNDKIYKLTTELSFFSSLLDLGLVFSELKSIFEDETIKKITFDLKSHLHILHAHNISIQGEIFDISIAEYLVNAGVKYDITAIKTALMLSKYKELTDELAELNLSKLYSEIELPLTYVLCDMEEEGFKIDDKALVELGEKYNQELGELTNKIYDFAGVKFNINSPKQLAEILFSKLGLKSYMNKKLSTNIDVLNELTGQHEIIPLVIRYRKLFKLYTTYIESYRQIVNTTGNIIHTVFNQTLTSTGRLSSSEPNLQNIPVRDDEGKNLRKLFASKFENGVLISADYNQIELRLLAAFSGDENMIRAYLEGKDIHKITASQIFGVALNEVTPDMRREAKAVNFGIIYGISDYGLATNIGISRQRAKEYIEKYFYNYPKVKIYMDNNVEIAKRDGMVRTLFNRIRRIPEITSSNFQLRQFGERVAMNMPLQGSASDIIKLAMINVYNELKKQGLKSKIILQIHDELIVDTAEGEEEKVKEILKKLMENAVSLTVKLPVAVESGKTWYDCK